MMSEKNEVYLYAGDENEARCTELITCITRDEQRMLIGIESAKDNLKAEFDLSKNYWQLFNSRCLEGLKKRVKPGDFICVITGICAKPIADAFPDNITVEYGIGYGGTFSKFRVFESYSWMHTIYGSQGNNNPHAIDGRFYDVVIPNYFDPDDFECGPSEKDDYYLFIGRLIDRKGYSIASDVCQRLGKKLIVAGQGEPLPVDKPNYVGVVGVKERSRLMKNAKAVFVPTLYIEPFGGVAVEAQMCGTPVITTDWGAFTETVLHGKTGFRCRTLEQFIYATENIMDLEYSAKKIRDYAEKNYSTTRVALMYEEYFDMLAKLSGKGWYTESKRFNLDWLNRYYE